MSKATKLDCGGKRSEARLLEMHTESENGVAALRCHRTPKTSRIACVAFSAVAAILLLLALKLPLWQMRMEAPQYRDEEALQIAVHPDAMRGDLNELTVLNHYIGVHVPPTLPQFKWLPGVLIAGAVLSLIGGLLPGLARRWVLLGTGGALATAMLIAALQAKSQMHDIGHKRDQKTILVGVKDFTPPLLGTTKIAQFTVSSRFGIGAWLIGAALVLQFGAVWLSRQRRAGVEPVSFVKEFALSRNGDRRDACPTLS
jgi:hypothetical protein